MEQVEIKFKINDEIVSLFTLVDGTDHLFKITNDDQYAVQYIHQLINNGFISLKAPLETIARNDDDNEIIIYPPNIEDPSMPACTGVSETLEQQTPDSLNGSTAVVKWSNESTYLLINLVEKFDAEFQTTLKQFVWKKIARIINDTFKTTFTATQVDTKWKGLKRTYHDVKKHNNTSGNSIKKWHFYDKMDNFLFKKPEINPPATCSNFKGLVLHKDDMDPINQETSKEIGQASGTPDEDLQYTPSFKKRRKVLGSADKRHKDKMERTDRFLNLFERLVTAVEKKEQQ